MRRNKPKTCRDLVFILGDQLSPSISSLAGTDPEHDVVLMCETKEETTYVKHHRKKIVFFLSAMRHFAAELGGLGYTVRYIELDDPENTGSFATELTRAVSSLSPRRVLVTQPGEWRVEQAFRTWQRDHPVPLEFRPDDRFICPAEEFDRWAQGRKQLTMEFFYREMRRKTGLLMRDGGPEGGRWNFDHENRRPAKPDLLRTGHPRYRPDEITQTVMNMVQSRFEGHMGSVAGFCFAVRRQDAEEAARIFIRDFLPEFGATQDAMLSDDAFLNHSLLSFYLNVGLLDPLALCRDAEEAYRRKNVPLNAVEGFIRQIIGWREYMRGIYWRFMPAYAENNHLDAARPLPGFFWTGETAMACLATVISATVENAYAHHIQRLMITGNFALLCGIDPGAVHKWYLEVYADAVEWVELPNVIGMSQFADGGLLGSKPYAAGGAYISRMSDYCSGCHYDVRKKTGDGACPFNALYWSFLHRNEEKLRRNQRLQQPYAAWHRMPAAGRQAYLESADAFLGRLDRNESV